MATSPNGSLIEPDSKSLVWITGAGGLIGNYLVKTARRVWELATRNRTGVFHGAGAERLSRWQIGQLLARRRPELRAKIEPGSARDFPGPPRAPDTSLNISRIQEILSAPLPGLSEWLAANPHEPF